MLAFKPVGAFIRLGATVGEILTVYYFKFKYANSIQINAWNKLAPFKNKLS